MQCLAYAVQKYKAITGKPSPSTAADDEVGTWFDNAAKKTQTIRSKCVACWRDKKGYPRGHALCVGELVPGLNKYECYEANWDDKGNTRTRYWDGTEIKNLYINSKDEFLGYVYN